MFRLIKTLVLKAEEESKDDKEVDKIINAIETIYLYAVTWSIGGNTDLEGRKSFSRILKEIMKECNEKNGTTIPIPEDSYYDYTIDMTTYAYIKWTEVQEKFEFKYKMSFDEIIVPTVDSTKYLSISSRLLKSH